MRQAPRCRHLANRTGCPGGLRCFLPVLYLYLYNLSGAQLAPPDTDTGLTVLTPDYLSQFLKNSRFQGGSPAQQYLPRPSGAIDQPEATTST